MKFISWNIDSLNAALTGKSARADLTRAVLDTIAEEDADIIAIQETKLPAVGMNKKQAEALEAYFPGYDAAWVSSHERRVKAMRTMAPQEGAGRDAGLSGDRGARAHGRRGAPDHA